MSKVCIRWMDVEEPTIIPNVKDIIHEQDKTLVLAIDDEKHTEIMVLLSNIRFIAAEDEI